MSVTYEYPHDILVETGDLSDATDDTIFRSTGTLHQVEEVDLDTDDLVSAGAAITDLTVVVGDGGDRGVKENAAGATLDASALDLQGANVTNPGTVDGRNVSTDGAKLDTIETSADVTDTTNVDTAGAVMESDFDAKGDILSATANDTPSIVGIGSDGQVPVADSAQSEGWSWADREFTAKLWPPATLYANSTSAATSRAKDTAHFIYMGKAQQAYTSIKTIVEVTTAYGAGLGATGAEIAVYEGAPALGANPATLNRLGSASVTGDYNSTGIVSKAVTVSGVSIGDHLWFVYWDNPGGGSSFQLAAMMADRIRGGGWGTVSTAGAPSSNSTYSVTRAGAAAVPGWTQWEPV